MFKLIVSLAIIVGLACAATTDKDPRAELVDAGLSPLAIDGILRVTEKVYNEFSSKYGGCAGFQEAAETGVKLFFNLEKFMKTQTKEDQKKYMAYAEKKKEEFNN